MSKPIQVFEKENLSSVRTVNIDGEVWFVVSDICDYFEATNRNRTMQSINPDEKGSTQINTRGGIQTVAIVNESGLYSMLFEMQPKKARGVSDEYIAKRCEQLKKFRHWVTHDVLPSIRKHGIYATDEFLNNPDIAIAALMAIKAEHKRGYAKKRTVSLRQ